MPNFVRAVSAVGVDVLRAHASRFAEWQLRAPIDTSLDDASTLAADYVLKLNYPSHFFAELPADAKDRVAAAVGCPRKADWVTPEVPDSMPDYLRPTWEGAVLAVLLLELKRPPATLRADAERQSHAAAWFELSTLSAWKDAKDKPAVAGAIARSLGDGFAAVETAGDYALPRIHCRTCGVEFIAIPGGSFTEGLSPAERSDLTKRMKRLSPEARIRAKDIAKSATPPHEVVIDPVLIARTPLMALHAAANRLDGDDANAHRVLRTDSDSAASIAAKLGFRLVSEAEWEWVARAGGTRAWLSDAEDPEGWATRVVSAPLESMAHPLGVLGLGWGEWVDDGWHPNYKGAPSDGRAWQPKNRPEVARGGGLASIPWQGAGELVLCHAAVRDRAGDGPVHAIRLAYDLPAR